VQSLELQGPPVSAMMLALTAMMYAICTCQSDGFSCKSARRRVIQQRRALPEQIRPTVKNVTVPARSSSVKVDLRSSKSKYRPNCRQTQRIVKHRARHQHGNGGLLGLAVSNRRSGARGAPLLSANMPLSLPKPRPPYQQPGVKVK
jgi:hypothetical protein